MSTSQIARITTFEPTYSLDDDGTFRGYGMLSYMLEAQGVNNTAFAACMDQLRADCAEAGRLLSDLAGVVR